jgi:hypothetical protein
MKITLFILILLFSRLSFAGLSSVDVNDSSTKVKTPNILCSEIFNKREVSSENRFLIAVERSTDEIVQLLTSHDLLSRNSDQWITVDLIQDQSHLTKAPPIPDFAITIIARNAFNKKIKARLDDQRPYSELPKLKKMYFSKLPDEFKGVATTLSAHTIIKIKVKDLRAVVDWFVETMYHPALGNKVFKISLVD